jgi:3-deoxy-D-manno-octulosonic-acid transferase
VSGFRRLLYEAAGTVSSVLLLPALAGPKWREGLGERLGVDAEPGRCARTGPVWIHGASVGEVLAARGLVKAIMEKGGKDGLVFSTFTPTGRRAAREAFAAYGDRVCCRLLPIDWWGVSRRVLDRIRPRLFVIVETEIWPGLLGELSSLKVPTVIVNGRMSSRSLPRYRVMRWFFRPFVAGIDLVCVRTERDAGRFRSIGVPEGRIRVTGNIKYERVTPQVVPQKVRRLGMERHG